MAKSHPKATEGIRSEARPKRTKMEAFGRHSCSLRVVALREPNDGIEWSTLMDFK